MNFAAESPTDFFASVLHLELSSCTSELELDCRTSPRGAGERPLGCRRNQPRSMSRAEVRRMEESVVVMCFTISSSASLSMQDNFVPDNFAELVILRD